MHTSLYNICRQDSGYTPPHKADPTCQKIRHPILEQLSMEYHGKALRGQFFLVQNQRNNDKEAFNLWLRGGKLMLET